MEQLGPRVAVPVWRALERPLVEIPVVALELGSSNLTLREPQYWVGVYLCRERTVEMALTQIVLITVHLTPTSALQGISFLFML